MNNLEIIPADVSGYCDVETGECITVDAPTSMEGRTPEDVATSHETSAIGPD